MKNLGLLFLSTGCLAIAACSTSPEAASPSARGTAWIVSPASVGPIRLGMTVAQVQAALSPGYELVDPPNAWFNSQSAPQGVVDQEIGGPALLVANAQFSVKDPSGHKIMEFLTSDPANPQAPGSRVVMISLLGSRFSTAAGVRPGDKIADVAQIYGPPSLLDNDPEGFGREWVVFRRGPASIRFQSSQAGERLAGIYSPASEATSSYASGSEVRAIVIGRR